VLLQLLLLLLHLIACDESTLINAIARLEATPKNE
jgi:hypothetical protein